MTVKALCGVFYNGVLHRAGETFNADTLLPNTEQIIINEQPSAETKQQGDKSEGESPRTPDFGGKSRKRG